MQLLQATYYIDYARAVVLPKLRELQRRLRHAIRAGLLGELLGLSRRQTYNYLRALEIAGCARREGKKLWKAA